MAKDRLQHLYRYNITQTEVLARDYTALDLRGRACVWVPGEGIYLPSDAAGIPFGVIQRVFVTGARNDKLREFQTKGRTVTVLQHGLMPDFLAQAAIAAGQVVLPFGVGTGTTGTSAANIANRGKWLPYPGVTGAVGDAAETLAYTLAQQQWPMVVQAYTAASGENDRFVAYIH